MFLTVNYRVVTLVMNMPVTSEKFILVFEANCINNQIQAGYSLKGVQWLVFADVQMFSGYYRVFTTEMDKTVLWPLTVNLYAINQWF